MDRIIKFTLIRFADSQQLMRKRQHGFLYGRSCFTNLLNASEQWTRALDKKAGVDVIYFDFKKPFDCVFHLRMLHNLNEVGICGRLHSRIQSFLTKRTLRVKVGETYSKCIDVTSGVPQGSVIGPVLFLLYINDCLKGLSCDAAMFADDVKTWRTIESPSGVQSLQNDVDYLSSWSQGALMSLNTDKCVVLRLQPRKAKDNDIQYQLNEEHLRSANHQRDLGVIVDETLKPHHQSTNSIMRAKASFINITLTLIFICPHLEYSFQAWRPWLRKYIKLQENAQRHST